MWSNDECDGIRYIDYFSGGYYQGEAICWKFDGTILTHVYWHNSAVVHDFMVDGDASDELRAMLVLKYGGPVIPLSLCDTPNENPKAIL